jgi:uncharacterized protein (DUF1330 family)
MAKGYWIAHVDVSDPEAYQLYRAANAEPLHKYGARFLVRAGDFAQVEGASRSRHIVLEFVDYGTALACYHSSEYQKAFALRRRAAETDLVVIAGYDGPQPEPIAQETAGTTPKGFWVGHVDVIDPEGFDAFVAAALPLIGRFGGRFLVRGGAFERVEGAARSRTMLLEFPSYAVALACFDSPDHQAAAALRKGKAELDLTVCEGYEGTQP